MLMSYLAFEILYPTENYIICPQAPSKFYLGEDFKHVGACWLTKEDTVFQNDAKSNDSKSPGHEIQAIHFSLYRYRS